MRSPFAILMLKTHNLVEKKIDYKDWPRWIKAGHWLFNFWITYCEWDEIKRGFPHHKVRMNLRKNRKALEKKGIYLNK